MALFALILVIGALVCFIVETFRLGFNLLALGLACLAAYFVIVAATATHFGS